MAGIINCENCIYWDKDRSPFNRSPDVRNMQEKSDIGQCRRRAPRNISHTGEGRGLWPFTLPTDGCGDGEPRP